LLKKAGLILLAIVLFTGLLTACSSAMVTTTPAQTSKPVPTAIQSTTPPTATPLAATTTTPPPSTTTKAGPVTITDQYGRTVTVKSSQRIISLSPAHTEILFALGLGSRVVGVSDYSDYPAEAANVASIGGYDSPNMEKIISLEPDLVLATEEHEKAVDQLTKYNIPTIALNPKTVNEVFDTITLIGKVTGTDVKAASLVNDMKTRMAKITAITSQLRDAQKPKVFMVIWFDPIWTVGAGTFHDELIKMAGGINIAGNLSGYTDMSIENVITDNPQIIIAGVGMGTGNDAALKAMLTDDRLSNTDARLNNWVYGANMDIISRPGPRLADALEILFKLIHPELQ
jgi:iron complex transport system substrate-binding protein